MCNCRCGPLGSTPCRFMPAGRSAAWRQNLFYACNSAVAKKIRKLLRKTTTPTSHSRNTLANANRVRPWRIYADFAQHLIAQATELYADTDLGFDLDNTIYALDSTTIDLCLSLFPWATFRRTKSAVKMHTLLNLKDMALRDQAARI